MTPLSQALASTPSSRIGPIEYAPPPPSTTSRRPGDDAREGESIEPTMRGEDRVEISPQAQQALRAGEAPIRSDLVTRVRAEIAAGTYETPERLDLAVRRAVRSIDQTA